LDDFLRNADTFKKYKALQKEYSQQQAQLNYLEHQRERLKKVLDLSKNLTELELRRNMEQFIGCDAHKNFSVFVAVNEKGNAGEAVRVAHERQLYREFLGRLPPHSAIAVEASGHYSWLVDEMERSGHRPKLANPLEAKIGDIGWGDPVHHVGGRVAQHALGADIEYLNDAFLVGGDTREVGAVENRVLQGPRFKQSLFAADLGGDIHRASGILGSGRIVVLRHVPTSVELPEPEFLF
jgi:hypothetical protein